MNLTKILTNLIGCEFEKPELTKILDNHYHLEEVYDNGLILYSNNETNILYDPLNDKRVDLWRKQC